VVSDLFLSLGYLSFGKKTRKNEKKRREGRKRQRQRRNRQRQRRNLEIVSRKIFRIGFRPLLGPVMGLSNS